MKFSIKDIRIVDAFFCKITWARLYLSWIKPLILQTEDRDNPWIDNDMWPKFNCLCTGQCIFMAVRIASLAKYHGSILEASHKSELKRSTITYKVSKSLQIVIELGTLIVTAKLILAGTLYFQTFLLSPETCVIPANMKVSAWFIVASLTYSLSRVLFSIKFLSKCCIPNSVLASIDIYFLYYSKYLILSQLQKIREAETLARWFIWQIADLSCYRHLGNFNILFKYINTY